MCFSIPFCINYIFCTLHFFVDDSLPCYRGPYNLGRPQKHVTFADDHDDSNTLVPTPSNPTQGADSTVSSTEDKGIPFRITLEAYLRLIIYRKVTTFQIATPRRHAEHSEFNT